MPTKYDCDTQVFPINGVKPQLSYNLVPQDVKKCRRNLVKVRKISSSDIYQNYSHICLPSKLVVIFFLLMT